ncbi:MAG: hypothetical protein GY772_19875 [bacterium]|nr:hypothetical protein [bacterium]
MHDLLRSVVDVQRIMAESQQKRTDRELLTRLKVDQKLKPITGETDYGLLEEILEFELQMERMQVTTFREWYQCFDRALEGKARNWSEEQLLFGPGQLYFLEAQRNEHIDGYWQRLYYFMRSQLLRRVGVQYEAPGVHARQQWEKVRFPESVRTCEDVDEVLERILVTRKRMVLTGQMIFGRVEMERRELQDLERKVPKGSQLRLFIYTIAGAPESFRQWFERCQRYASGLPRRGHPDAGPERQRMVVETPAEGEEPPAGEEEEDPDEEPDEDVDPWEEVDPWLQVEDDEKGLRMSDFRQASGGLRRPKARAKGRPKCGAGAGAAFGRVCSGGRGVWRCPNVVARM